MGTVFETLIQLAFVAAVQTAALEQIFATRLYQKYLGKGIDGGGSVYCTGFELRPWISSAAGIFLAWMFDLNALVAGLGMNYADLVAVKGTAALSVDMVFTGLIIGGGTKAIKKIAKDLGNTRTNVKTALGG